MTCSPGAGGGGALARYLSLSWSFSLENSPCLWRHPAPRCAWLPEEVLQGCVCVWEPKPQSRKHACHSRDPGPRSTRPSRQVSCGCVCSICPAPGRPYTIVRTHALSPRGPLWGALNRAHLQVRRPSCTKSQEPLQGHRPPGQGVRGAELESDQGWQAPPSLSETLSRPVQGPASQGGGARGREVVWPKS